MSDNSATNFFNGAWEVVWDGNPTDTALPTSTSVDSGLSYSGLMRWEAHAVGVESTETSNAPESISRTSTPLVASSSTRSVPATPHTQYLALLQSQLHSRPGTGCSFSAASVPSDLLNDLHSLEAHMLYGSRPGTSKTVSSRSGTPSLRPKSNTSNNVRPTTSDSVVTPPAPVEVAQGVHQANAVQPLQTKAPTATETPTRVEDDYQALTTAQLIQFANDQYLKYSKQGTRQRGYPLSSSIGSSTAEELSWKEVHQWEMDAFLKAEAEEPIEYSHGYAVRHKQMSSPISVYHKPVKFKTRCCTAHPSWTETTSTLHIPTVARARVQIDKPLQLNEVRHQPVLCTSSSQPTSGSERRGDEVAKPSWQQQQQSDFEQRENAVRTPPQEVKPQRGSEKREHEAVWSPPIVEHQSNLSSAAPQRAPEPAVTDKQGSRVSTQTPERRTKSASYITYRTPELFSCSSTPHWESQQAITPELQTPASRSVRTATLTADRAEIIFNHFPIPIARPTTASSVDTLDNPEYALSPTSQTEFSHTPFTPIPMNPTTNWSQPLQEEGHFTQMPTAKTTEPSNMGSVRNSGDDMLAAWEIQLEEELQNERAEAFARVHANEQQEFRDREAHDRHQMVGLECYERNRNILPGWLTPFHAAANKIQMMYACHKAVNSLKMMARVRDTIYEKQEHEQEQRMAAVHIQRVVRGVWGRLHCQKRLKQHKQTLDKNMRWNSIVSDLNDEQRLKRIMITTLQREVWVSIVDKWNTSSTQKQEFYPYVYLGDNVIQRAKMGSRLNAAKKIQIAYKAHYSRTVLKERRNEREVHIKQIENEEQQNNLTKTASIAIQRNWRRWSARRYVNSLLLNREQRGLVILHETIERKSLVRKAERKYESLRYQLTEHAVVTKSKQDKRIEQDKIILLERTLDRPTSSLVRNRLQMVGQATNNCDIVELLNIDLSAGETIHKDDPPTFSMTLPIQVLMGLEAEEQVELLVEESKAREQEEQLERKHRDEIQELETRFHPSNKKNIVPVVAVEDPWECYEEIPNSMMSEREKNSLMQYNEVQRNLKIRQLVTTEKMSRREVASIEHWEHNSIMEGYHTSLRTQKDKENPFTCAHQLSSVERINPKLTQTNISSSSTENKMPASPKPYNVNTITSNNGMSGSMHHIIPTHNLFSPKNTPLVAPTTPPTVPSPKKSKLPSLKLSPVVGLPNVVAGATTQTVTKGSAGGQQYGAAKVNSVNGKPATKVAVGRIRPSKSANDAIYSADMSIFADGSNQAAPFRHSYTAEGGTIMHPNATEAAAKNCQYLVDHISYNMSTIERLPDLTLDLSCSHIDDSKLTLLLSSLSTHPSLKILKLDGNSITDVGCEQLGIFLAQQNTITTLSLRDNLFTAAGVGGLAHALLHNSSLLHLEIGNIPNVESTITQQMDRMLKRNQEASNRINAVLYNTKYKRKAAPLVATSKLGLPDNF